MSFKKLIFVAALIVIAAQAEAQEAQRKPASLNDLRAEAELVIAAKNPADRNQPGIHALVSAARVGRFCEVTNKQMATLVIGLGADAVDAQTLLRECARFETFKKMSATLE